MPESVRVRGLYATYEIVRGTDRRASRATSAHAFEAEIAHVVRDPQGAAALLAMLREVGLVTHMPPSELTGLAQLARIAFAQRRLAVLSNARELGGGVRVGEPHDEAPPPRSDEEAPRPVEDPPRDWLELELVDREGSPVAYARYELELADGSTRDGRLDAMGFARIEGIAPGSCNVRFPGFDGREWAPG